MNQRGFLAPVLIILLIAAVSGGYLFYTKSFKSTPVPQKSSAVPQTPQPSSVLTSATPSPISSPSIMPIKLSGEITWSVPAGSIPSTEETAIKYAFGNLNVKIDFPGESYVEIVGAHVSDGWGAFYGAERFNTPHNWNPTATYVFLGHKVQSNWKLITTGDPEFCSTLQQIPETVMTQLEKDYYIGCKK